jgi:carbon storage regulator
MTVVSRPPPRRASNRGGLGRFPIILDETLRIAGTYDLRFEQTPLKAPATGISHAESGHVGDDHRGRWKDNNTMLVLTRKLMEKLYIGDDICVTVVRLEGGQVRLGIEAPLEVAVVRAELVPERRMERPKRAARVVAVEGEAEQSEPDLRLPPIVVREPGVRRRERFR